MSAQASIPRGLEAALASVAGRNEASAGRPVVRSDGGSAKKPWVVFVGDLLFASCLAIALIAVASQLSSPDGISVIRTSAGVIAGLLILLPVRRWPTYLVVYLLGQAAFYAFVADLTPVVILVRTIPDVAGIVVYAAIVRSRRNPAAGLGVDVPLAFAAAVLAAAIRMAPIAGLQMFSDPLTSAQQTTLWIQAPLGSVIGIIVWSAVVLGLARWRETLPWRGREFISDVGLAALCALAVVAAFSTPLGQDIPGSQYLVVAIMLVIAARLPFPWVALLNGFASLAIALSMVKGIGVFSDSSTLGPWEVLGGQAYLLVVTVSVFLLSAAMSQRRLADDTAQRSAKIRRQMFETSPVPSAWVRIDPRGRIFVLEGNAALAELLTIERSALAGHHLDSVTSSPDGDVAMPLLASRDARLHVAEGRTLWVRTSVAQLAGDNGPRSRHHEQSSEDTLLVLRDTTASHTMEELGRRQSAFDHLTGAFGRAALVERLERPFDTDGGRRLGVILLNIDGLRGINDAFGYATGDQVLVHMSDRIRANVGTAFVARVGGDEFAVVLSGDRDHIESLAHRLLVALREPVALSGTTLVITATARVALEAPDDSGRAEVLHRADVALSRAKSLGRNRVGTVEPGAGAAAASRVRVESQLRAALDGHTLECRYEPVVDLRTGGIVELKSVACLPAVDDGLVSPSLLVAVAGELGLLEELTGQVVDEICRDARQLRALDPDVPIAIDLPPACLTPEWAGRVSHLAEVHDVPLTRIAFDLAEDGIPELDPRRREVLDVLSRAGVRLAVDRFGAGQSGLSSLLAVPFDAITIDRAFVAAMFASPEDLTLMRSIIDLIDHLRKVSVAEGIETEEEYLALRDMGCRWGRGPFVGRPVAPRDAWTPAGQNWLNRIL